MTDDPPLASMSLLIYGTMRAKRILLRWKNRIEVGFQDVRFMTIDSMQGGVRVEGEIIWSITIYRP